MDFHLHVLDGLCAKAWEIQVAIAGAILFVLLSTES
jgi:hypothetical protein